MLDPESLFTVDTVVWESLRNEKPVMIVLLEGFVDAGNIPHHLSSYLLEHCEHEVVVTFDIDQLHDYRSRRPVMTFDTDAWVSMQDFSLTIQKVTDDVGTHFLLFSGPEPDVQWHRTVEAVLRIARELNITRLISAAALPMAVPHTRPVLITSHSNDPQSTVHNPAWLDRVQLPGSFAIALEYLAGKSGLSAMGFVAHVPHYLAQGRYPQAGLEILTRINEAAGLAISVSDLFAQAAGHLEAVDQEARNDSDFPAMLTALEEQYDELQSNPVPSADEIGAAAEQFLAAQAEQDDQLDTGSPDQDDSSEPLEPGEGT